MLGESTVIRATTLREQVFQAIRKEILTGRLKPGEKLLEAEMAARLGLSRNPVREAIARLEQTGLVRTVPNRGTYVVQLNEEQAHDMALLRVHLELLAVRLAVTRAHEGQFDSLIAVVERMQALLTKLITPAAKLGEITMLDSEFHERLVSCSQSEALCRAWSAVAPCDLVFVQEYISRRADEQYYLQEIQASVRDHVELLAALRSGSADTAMASARRHYTAVKPGEYGKIADDEFLLLA